MWRLTVAGPWDLGVWGFGFRIQGFRDLGCGCRVFRSRAWICLELLLEVGLLMLTLRSGSFRVGLIGCSF